VRPSSERLYLRHAAEDREYVLPAGDDVLRTAELALQDSRVAARGAANDAFNALFALPFGTDAVASYRAHPMEELSSSSDEGSGISTRTAVGSALAVVGAAGVVTGVAALLSARSLRADIDPLDSQENVSRTNDRIAGRNRLGAILAGAGGAAMLGGALLLFWPESPAQLAVTPDGVIAGWRGRF
jgi:hypothetical protein